MRRALPSRRVSISVHHGAGLSFDSEISFGKMILCSSVLHLDIELGSCPFSSSAA